MKAYVFCLLLLSALSISLPRSSNELLAEIKENHKQAAFSKTISLCEEALAEAKGNTAPLLKADILTYFAASQIMLNRYAAAIDNLEKAQQLIKKKKKTLRYLRIQNELGQAYLGIGDCVHTRQVLEESLTQFEGNTEDNELANTYDHLGAYWGEIGDGELAKYYFLKAKAIREKNQNTAPLDLHLSIEFLALLEQNRGNYDGAIATLLKGLRTIEDHHGNYLQKGNFLRRIAENYREKGDIETALQYLEASLSSFTGHEADAKLKIVQVYWAFAITKRMGDRPKEADSYFLKALHLLEGDKKNTARYTRGLILHDYALLKVGLKAFDEADSMLTESTQLLIGEYEGCGWFIHQSTQIRSTQANILYRQGKHKEAIAAYHKSINRIKIEFGDQSPLLSLPYNNIGLTYSDVSAFDSASIYYNKALDILHPNWESLTDFSMAMKPIQYSYIIWNKAENQYWNYAAGASLEHLKLSFKYFDAYARSIDYLRRSYLEEASKIGFANNNKIAYEKCISVLYSLHSVEPDQGWDRKAFEYLEKSKSLVLLEAVKRSQADAFENVPLTIIEKEKVLRRKAGSAENKYYNYVSRFDAKDPTVIKAKAINFEEKKKYYDFLTELEREHPNYHRIKHEVKVQSLAEIQEGLKEKDQAILAYYEGEANLYLFYISHTNFKFYLQPKNFPLVEWINTFRQSITAYHGIPIENRSDSLYKASLQSYISTSSQLYDKLIAPLSADIARQEDIIIIPDGHLAKLPFEALLSKVPSSPADFDTYPYLLKQYRFSYCYSASLLQEMMTQQHPNNIAKGALALAPFSERNGLPLAEKGLNKDRKNFSILPYSKEEVKNIIELEGGKIALAAVASKSFFLAHCPNYRILHLSTHAVANALNGAESFLAFYTADKLEGYEPLFVRELYNLDLNADLVVLSACETNLGQLQMGEGIISLARAFAYAGAKSILPTLWVVDDAAMKDITTSFYTALKTGVTKDKALQEAKLQHLKGNNNSLKHPFYWAAMIAVGDMSSMH